MRKPAAYIITTVLLLLWSSAVFAQKAVGSAGKKAPRTKCTVSAEYRHDTGSYTQGLFFHDGKLYESAGQYGESSMRITDFATGRVVKRRNFGREYFIEGSCICKGNLYILTWREHTCFVCNPETLESVGTLRYAGEGWGLTTDGENLIMSDGSSGITFRDPRNLAVIKTIEVTLDGKEVKLLNELEYIDGEIWANVYCSDFIVRIDPSTGKVNSVLDCRGILPDGLKKPSTDVLNGIAYNPKDKSIYITGKLWPRLYKISDK